MPLSRRQRDERKKRDPESFNHCTLGKKYMKKKFKKILEVGFCDDVVILL